MRTKNDLRHFDVSLIIKRFLLQLFYQLPLVFRSLNQCCGNLESLMFLSKDVAEVACIVETNFSGRGGRACAPRVRAAVLRHKHRTLDEAVRFDECLAVLHRFHLFVRRTRRFWCD